MLYRDGRMLRSADARVWTLYEDLNTLKPWGNYELYCPWTHLSGTPDVLVMVSHIMGVWLHRLRDEFALVVVPPPVEPAPEPAPAEPPPPAADAGILTRTISDMAVGEVRRVLAANSPLQGQLHDRHLLDRRLDSAHALACAVAAVDLVRASHRAPRRGLLRRLGLLARHSAVAGYAEGGNGHWYGWSADDGSGSIYAKGRRLNVATENWDAIASAPTTNGSNGTMLAWQANVGRMARYGGDAQRWQEYDPATNAWTVHANKVGHGQHALLEYHLEHRCCLLIGGNDSSTKATLVSPGFTNVTPLPDCPGDLRMSAGSWIVPHPDGGWLVRAHMVDGTSHIFHIRPGDLQWRDLGPFPKLGLGYQSAAIDPRRRAVLLATTTGLHAWKIPPV
jgi:hypothetical protein